MDQQALLAALHGQRELADRDVGDRREGGADAAVFHRLDHAVQLDLDLALEVGEQVGQGVVRGDQVDGAGERIFEQRRFGRGVAVDRPRRAFVGGQLDAGADRLDVGLVDQLRARQGQRRAGDVGVAGARVRVARSFGWPARRVCAAAEEAGRQLRPEVSAPQFEVWNGTEAEASSRPPARPGWRRRRSASPSRPACRSWSGSG